MAAGAIIEIGDDAGISSSTLVAREKISLGPRSIIGAECLIVDNDFHSLDAGQRQSTEDIPHAKPVAIDADVFVGARSILLKGITIGHGVVIGAGSVVTKDVNAETLCAGNPAVQIRNLRK